MELQFTSEDAFRYLVAESIGTSELEKAATEGRKLRIKLGIDPTSTNIHVGRTLPLWRLRAFQELGHEIHLIVGDFTGQVGDTSDKDAERPMLTPEVIAKNLERYEEQLWMVLNPEKKDQVVFHRNSEWLNTLTLAEISQLADAFSVAEFTHREVIARRLAVGSRVSLREMIYPLMQGYDSIAIKADIELGGTDQRFNLLAGRTLQEKLGQPTQGIIMGPMMSGLDGKKMSSSQGNGINLLDSPADKFGKMMTMRDEVMSELLAIYPRSARPFTPEELQRSLGEGINPRDLKISMAHRLVALYHGQEEADKAQQQFISQFTENQLPEIIEEVQVSDRAILAVMTEHGLAPTRSEARRLIEQGGVRFEGDVVTEMHFLIPDTGGIVQVGKRKFIKVLPA